MAEKEPDHGQGQREILLRHHANRTQHRAIHLTFPSIRKKEFLMADCTEIDGRDRVRSHAGPQRLVLHEGL